MSRDDDDAVSLPKSLPSGTLQIVGLVAGLAPFFFSTTSVTTMNGVVTSYFDGVGVAGGAVAAAIGAWGLFSALRASGEGRGKALGLAAGALALGAFQLVRGLGAFV